MVGDPKHLNFEEEMEFWRSLDWLATLLVFLIGIQAMIVVIFFLGALLLLGS